MYLLPGKLTRLHRILIFSNSTWLSFLVLGTVTSSSVLPLSQAEPIAVSSSAAIIVAPPTSLSSGVVVSPPISSGVVAATTARSSHGGETPPPVDSERRIGKFCFFGGFSFLPGCYAAETLFVVVFGKRKSAADTTVSWSGRSNVASGSSCNLLSLS